jgi:hypothetical protein
MVGEDLVSPPNQTILGRKGTKANLKIQSTVDLSTHSTAGLLLVARLEVKALLLAFADHLLASPVMEAGAHEHLLPTTDSLASSQHPLAYPVRDVRCP